MNGRFLVLAALVTGMAFPATAQIVNGANGGSSASPLLLGNNAGASGATSSGRAIQPYTGYGSTTTSSSSHESIAQLMSENSQGMADTGTKFANERAQRIEAERAQEALQQEANARTGGGGGTASAPAPVVLQYTPPSSGTTAPPRTFHID